LVGYHSGALPKHLQTISISCYRLRPFSSLSLGGLSCFHGWSRTRKIATLST
jgi:hypothetical protein